LRREAFPEKSPSFPIATATQFAPSSYGRLDNTSARFREWLSAAELMDPH
jgi:hypothetical protein